MGTEFGFIKKSDIQSRGKGLDLCGECQAQGLNLCHIDEVCQVRLAQSLGREEKEVDEAVDYASKKGLLRVRTLRGRGKRPRKFIRITECGDTVFGLMR
jgi:hypothetical protein